MQYEKNDKHQTILGDALTAFETLMTTAQGNSYTLTSVDIPSATQKHTEKTFKDSFHTELARILNSNHEELDQNDLIMLLVSATGKHLITRNSEILVSEIFKHPILAALFHRSPYIHIPNWHFKTMAQLAARIQRTPKASYTPEIRHKKGISTSCDPTRKISVLSPPTSRRRARKWHSAEKTRGTGMKGERYDKKDWLKKTVTTLFPTFKALEEERETTEQFKHLSVRTTTTSPVHKAPPLLRTPAPLQQRYPVPLPPMYPMAAPPQQWYPMPPPMYPMAAPQMYPAPQQPLYPEPLPPIPMAQARPPSGYTPNMWSTPPHAPPGFVQTGRGQQAPAGYYQGLPYANASASMQPYRP